MNGFPVDFGGLFQNHSRHQVLQGMRRYLSFDFVFCENQLFFFNYEKAQQFLDLNQKDKYFL